MLLSTTRRGALDALTAAQLRETRVARRTRFWTTSHATLRDEKAAYNYALVTIWFAELFLLPDWNYRVWCDSKGLPEFMSLSLNSVPYTALRDVLPD